MESLGQLRDLDFDPYALNSYRQPFNIPYQQQFYSRNQSPGPSTATATPHRHSPVDDLFARSRQPDEFAAGPSAEHDVNQTQEDNPIDEEPLYVNAKQYFRILKRRVARARLEEVHRLSRQRKVIHNTLAYRPLLIVHQPYLHESRHKHAMRRPRGPGGRFLTAEEIAAQKSVQGNSIGSVHSPSNDNDDEGEDDEVPPIVFDEGQPLPRDLYQDAGSLANALSPNSRQTILASQSQHMQYATNIPTSNVPMTLQSSYSAMQQMHPPSQASMHYSNGMYPSTEGARDSEIHRQTEGMIHFGARGAGGS